MIDLPQPLEARAPGSGRASGSSKAPKSGPCREKEVFSLLPDDLLASMIACLDVKALLCLQQCDKRLARLAVSGICFNWAGHCRRPPTPWTRTHQRDRVRAVSLDCCSACNVQ
jgi:hypothetical protein